MYFIEIRLYQKGRTLPKKKTRNRLKKISASGGCGDKKRQLLKNLGVRDDVLRIQVQNVEDVLAGEERAAGSAARL